MDPKSHTSTEELIRDLQALKAVENPGVPDYSAVGEASDTPDVSGGVALECNQAQRLVPGQLLVIYGERCYQLNQENGEFTFLFELHRTPKTYFWMAIAGSDGYVYCTLSGTETEPTPQARASFGNWGGVYRVDHHHRRLNQVGRFVDPFGLQLIDNSKAIVADFEAWGPSGKIYDLDLHTGEASIIASQGYLVDPQGVVQDADGTLWVANAMHKEYDGSVVKIEPNNRQTVVVPRRGPRSGIVSGIGQHFEPDKLLVMVMDWPFMQTSQIFELNKKTLQCRTLLHGSAAEPRIWGNGALVGSTWWVGEAYRKEIVGIDLQTGKVATRIDASPITGAVKGVYDSFSFIENVSVVPKLAFGANTTTSVTVPDWQPTESKKQPTKELT